MRVGERGLALVKAAPNLVTIDELMSRVWPGLIVSPETVSQRVKLLRAALDDAPRNPRYIAGVRGRGYKVVATVVPVGAMAPAASSPKTETAKPATRKRSYVFWGSLAALSIAALAFAIWTWTRTPPQTTAAALPDRSVAVLPFENLGSSPQDAALAFGVAETLLHRLAGLKDLTVIARRSSFSFVSDGEDIRDIGRKLNARYIVEGSLQSDDTRLRITAQLIDATDGSHVWSMQFDRKPEDVFTIQDEIASKVAQAMQLTVGARRGSSATRNFDAYLAYAQGRSRLASGRVADARLAMSDLERAMKSPRSGAPISRRPVSPQSSFWSARCRWTRTTQRRTSSWGCCSTTGGGRHSAVAFRRWPQPGRAVCIRVRSRRLSADAPSVSALGPINPFLTQVTPMAMQSPWQFRAYGPPGLTSARYTKDLKEVRAYGSIDSTERTEQQSEIARFHTENPNQFWGRNLSALVASRNLGTARIARLLALLMFAQAGNAG